MTQKVLVPIAEGIEEIEAVSIIDVLRRAGAMVTVASVGAKQVTASRGVHLVADKLIGECMDEKFDMIALPGGLPGAEHLRDSVQLTQLLSDQILKGRKYAAICASPAVVLGHHGLLQDVSATCHPSLNDQLASKSHINARVVVDGNCITSQGPGTALEFALKLVEILFGKGKAKEVASPMITATNL
jgi:4-methyl-5(b-hydroxyethyl)-thiazole monophosphate biosynthesis